MSSKNSATYIAVIFRHSCLPVVAWRRVVQYIFELETIVASFSHLMVLLSKVLLNHSWKHQFVVLHLHIAFYDAYILNSDMKREPISFFTKSGKFTRVGDFYNTIITHLAVWRNSEIRRLDFISVANFNCGRKL